jgi:hypothetical protein
MRFSLTLPLFIFALLFLQTPQPQTSGIKMTVRRNMAGNSGEQTTYFEHDRKRMEYRNSEGSKKWNGSIQTVYGPHLAGIIRCDLGQDYELNLDTAEYTSALYPPQPLTQEQIAARHVPVPPTPVFPANKTLRIETITVDTGERKEMFGHTARHVIVTEKRIPLQGSFSSPQTSVTDGWYIDLDTQLSCDRKFPAGTRGYAYLLAAGANQPIDNPEFVEIGKRETGLALQQTYKWNSSYKLPEGAVKPDSSISEMVVADFQEGPLDEALFEIPPKFKKVSEIERMPPSAAAQSSWQEFWAWMSNLFDPF